MESTVLMKIIGIDVVDTLSGKLARGRTVTLRGDRIECIEPTTEHDDHPGAIDGRGKYLIPGFLDMHAHVLEDEHPEDALDLMLAHGITGWRQMSGSSSLLAQRRDGTLCVGPHAPALLAMPGQILTTANAASPDEARAEVRRQREQGADFIKTIRVSPKAFLAALDEASRLGLPYVGHLSPGVDAREAARRGMRSIEHLGPVELQLMSCSHKEWLIRALQRFQQPSHAATLSRASLKTAAANPILFRLESDGSALQKTQRLLDSYSEKKAEGLAQLMAHTGTWQVPTLIRNDTMQSCDEPRFTEHPSLRYVRKKTRELWTTTAKVFSSRVDAAARVTLDALMQCELRLVRLFEDAGVPMLTGTDYGGAFVVAGWALHQELDLLERSGLGALRVLQLATLEGARFMKREDSMGTVEVGKAADLVLLERNPLDRVAHLHLVAGVIRGGQYHSKHTLEVLKEAVAERVAAADENG